MAQRNEAPKPGEIFMMSRLNALIFAKSRAQKVAESIDQKRPPMMVLQRNMLRGISGGDGPDSPKGSWKAA